jgi:hypothetical protein
LISAYKLLRVRRDGSLGPLFIGREIVIPFGRWMRAESRPTKGFALRPGWHACAKPDAPHLSKRGRVWCKVTLKGVKEYHRPASQGGVWFTALWMRVLSRYRENDRVEC